MGVVYRAHDTVANRPVAIKVFTWHSAVDVERAQREVQVLTRLRHPAIVGHVGDGVTEEGQLYLAMNWIDGSTVAERLEGTGTSVADAVALAMPIAAALAFAHESGILHRDIKPSNVLLANDDPATSMLIDFGVARSLDAVTSLTQTGMTVGTPGYMSPEQARGIRELTPGVDVFGLGCLLYECVTGQAAFSGATSAAVMAKILFSAPTPVADLAPEAPPALVALIDRMLKKPLVQRVPDCGIVHQTLAELAPIPKGPRRNVLGVATITVAPDADPGFHCMVGAAQGPLDDMLEPPSPEACLRLARAAAAHDASLEVFANGAVCAHLVGEPLAVTARAAALALAMREILPRWAIAISSATAAESKVFDTGTRLLNGAALASIMRRGPEALQIRLDVETAAHLRDQFELTPGDAPRLIGPRPR